MVFPQSLHFSKNHMSQTSDSEEDDDEFYQVLRRFIILSLSLFFFNFIRPIPKNLEYLHAAR